MSRHQKALLGVFFLLLLAGTPSAAKAQPHWAIYVMRDDGSDVKKVSRLDENYCGSPNWAHDGKRLAFDVAPPDSDFRKSHIHVQTLGESASLDLGPGNTPCFSPDDSQILFMVPDAPGSLKKGVWVMNADGSGREWLSEGERPRWSPDGNKIVYTRRDESFPSIYIFDTLTLEHTRVLERGYDGMIGATWSPDGKELAFIG
jgi:Tol biopolymer transport system component